MTTSDLLSRMYAVPSRVMNEQQQTLMQTLHLRHASLASQTIARQGFSCKGLRPISSCSTAPYLHRVYWLLRNAEGQFLSGICGSVLQWAASSNDVPDELRFCSHQRVKDRWLKLRDLAGLSADGLSIAPVDFYAYCSTPHVWCALDD